ncbi:MAG TPA: hypothetical protein VIT92_06950 [Burkholderiaceae bacterium]
MKWLNTWMEGRRLRLLQHKIARLKKEVEEAENSTTLPAYLGLSSKILRERINVLEQAASRIEELKQHRHPGM